MRSPLNIHQSMFAQITLLTIAFMAMVAYIVAIKPLLDAASEVAEPVTPAEYTINVISDDIAMLLNKPIAEIESSAIEQSEHIQQVILQNPQFDYYLMVNDQVFTNKKEATEYYGEFGQFVDKLMVQPGRSNFCGGNTFDISDSDTIQLYVSMDYCQANSYYFEFGGVETPLVVPPELHPFQEIWVWERSAEVLIPAVGVFLIVLATILLNFRSVSRVTRVAEKIDERSLDTHLPISGLPLEVQPLVTAINDMIVRVKETQKHHEFFLSTAAHEMRTPLTVLRGNIDFLDDGELKSQLEREVRSLNNMVNQLLSLMRTGETQQPSKVIDVVECCKNVIADRASLVVDAGVDIGFIGDLEQLLITGDANLLEVAIANLLDNALSFSSAGDTIQIAVTKDRVLRVTDQGPGFEAQRLPNIFEPFAKFPSNRDGHGLGLAIVHAIVKLHNADITAHNSDEGGAIFEILFDSVQLN